jgi:oxygen-independent coproporphyrinogen III oxidase
MTSALLDKTSIETLLLKQIQHRQVNRVLHGHPGVALWDEGHIDVAAIMAKRRARSKNASLNVYVATPYCLPTNPDRCGFCLFPSEEYKGGKQLDEYLSYLRREGAMYRDFFEGEAPESIYFGGGTSNLYKVPQIIELMGIVRGVFPGLSTSAEITLEGIPQTYSRENLGTMKSVGINRISVGVQQFEDRLIKISGRTQKKEHVVRVLEWCHELALRSSVDLIFGWPMQTLEDMLNDLETAVSLGVSHITHYELNIGGRTDFALNHAAALPPIAATLEMFRQSCKYLAKAGFRQVSTYDWEKPDGTLQFEEATRRALAAKGDDDERPVDTWGWGFAAISAFAGTPEDPGWSYMNATRVSDCFSAIDAGRFPVQRGYHYSTEDLELNALYQALLGTEISRERYTRLFAEDVYEKYRPLWDVLVDRGWLQVNAEALKLVGDGIFFTPTIQSLLSRSRVQAIQAARVRSARQGTAAIRDDVRSSGRGSAGREQ